MDRHHSHLIEKELREIKGIPTDMRECTFTPNILKTNKASEGRGDIVKRLEAYLNYYEKRKEDCRNQE